MNNAITDLLDAVIPELGQLVADMRFWLGFAMLIGPVVLLISGIYYWFFAPDEANHKAGYRTYYGMGSVAAWKFTQGLAGKVWCYMGAGLLVAAIIGCVIVATCEPANAALPGLVVLAVEVVTVLVGYITIEKTVSRRFDAEGNQK